MANNFEEFWIGKRKTLYERFNKFYNQKAWQLDDNKKMDAGFLGTVKRKPLESGSRYEFHTGFINVTLSQKMVMINFLMLHYKAVILC